MLRDRVKLCEHDSRLVSVAKRNTDDPLVEAWLVGNMLSNGFVCLANVLAFAWVNELLHLFFFVIPESVLLVCQSLMGRRKSYSVSLPDHPFPCL